MYVPFSKLKKDQCFERSLTTYYIHQQIPSLKLKHTLLYYSKLIITYILSCVTHTYTSMNISNRRDAGYVANL